MAVNTRMSDLDCNFLTFVNSLINLTNRAWSQRSRIKFFEDLIYLFSIHYFEIFFRFFERMLWSIFSKMNELLSHFWADYISSMAHILESLNPDYTCQLYWFNKQIHPYISRFLEAVERGKQDYRSKYDDQLEKPQYVSHNTFSCFPNRTIIGPNSFQIKSSSSLLKLLNILFCLFSFQALYFFIIHQVEISKWWNSGDQKSAIRRGCCQKPCKSVFERKGLWKFVWKKS